MRSYAVTIAWALAFLTLPRAAAVAPATDPISSERPLFIFEAPGADAPDSLAHADRILAAWRALPEPLRPFSAMQIESPLTDDTLWPDRFRDVLRELQFASVPTFVSIANADPHTVYPLEELAQLLREFRTIRGVHVEGLRFNEYYEFGEMDPAGTPPQVRWLMGAIEVAGQAGRLIAVELGELHWARVMANAWCKPLYDTIARHRANVIAINDQRGPQNVTRSSALMGLWLEGAVGQWGLACHSDWYREARFVEPGVFGVSEAGSLMPPSIYRAMLLNGALTGAAVYRFENPEDLWFGVRRHYWDEAILPTLTELVGRGYIARKDLVQRKTRIAYRLNPSRTSAEFHVNLADIDAVYGQGRMLRGAYGLDRPGQIPELVLNRGRYYWIPILSPYALDETLRRFEEVILPGAMLDAQSWRERIEPYYRPDGEGAAFVSRVGRAIYVMHTRENLYQEQAFRLFDVPAPVRAVAAQRVEGGIELSWPFREGDLFYTVHRRVLPATSFTQIAGGLDDRRFLDAEMAKGQTVAYAVTALTNEKEPYEGTVNFGDYLIFDTAQSRIDEEVLLDAFTSSAVSSPVLPTIDTRPKSQIWWPTGLEGLEAGDSFVARAIVAQIEAWELAFVEEDLEALTNLYAEDYQDASGWGRPYVKAAYGVFLKRYRAGQMHRQIRQWDFSGYADAGEVRLRLYCRFTGLDESGPMGRFADLPVAFPKTPDSEVDLVFANRAGAWRVLRTDPPLPNLDELIAP